MNPTTLHSLLLVAVAAAITLALRALPFLAFPKGRAIPKWVEYLSNVLPGAVMGMLVIYCLRGITPLAWPFGLPELISAAVVVALHAAKHNTMLSIVAGTVCYMVLVQFVFV